MMNTHSWITTLNGTSTQGYALAVCMILLLMFVARRWSVVFFLTAFPFTLAHELMHWLMGLLTNGRPGSLSVWPQPTVHGYRLGSVSCHNVRWYNGMFIGLAPLLLLPCALATLLWRLDAQPQLNMVEAVWAYAVAGLVFASLPSWQDLRVALASSWLLIAVLAGVGFMLFSGLSSF